MRLIACLLLFSLPGAAAFSAEGDNWPLKGGNVRGQHYSPLAQVHDGNVEKLGLAWSRELPAPDGIATTPIVVDGIIYLSAAYSVVYAIDAGNGNVIWRYDPEVGKAFAKYPDLSWIARAQRGIALWKGQVFVTTADCRLLALDAGNGEPQWSVTTCDPDQGYSISDSPYVGGGKVYVGNSGSESGAKNRGYVSAYSPRDGALLWRFYTVPSDNPDENTTAALKMAAATWSGDALARFGGGGSVWNEMTYDPESGLLFFGTAGTLPYTFEKRSPDGGDNLFLSSVVAVDAASGDYRWHYQTVPQDSWEYNATMNIALDDFRIDGEQREALLIAPKNGFHYVLDRLTGELLAADKFAKVNWASHINLETGRPQYSPEAEYWRADASRPIAVWPNMWGAHSWNPMAWHPGLRLSFIPVIDMPSVVSYYDDGDFEDKLELVREVDGKPFSPGKLVAFDPLAGKARWTVHHDYPFNGGVMATAGNLVFQGDAHGKFSAYAADSGERLWSMDTGSPITAAPASYALDGQQYVVIPAGAGGGLQFVYPEMQPPSTSAAPTRLLAFRLDASQPLAVNELPERPLPVLEPTDATAAELQQGRDLYNGYCGYCHGRNAVARHAGSVPDLRFANQETHTQWQAIVIGGARQANGMPAIELTLAQSEAIRAYILSRGENLRSLRE